MQRQCSEIMKLGMQGTTLVVSSGDYGVASFPGDPNPTGCQGPDSTLFNPSYLAVCPYVLAVGSTQLTAYTTPNAPACKWNEVATTDFPSGGGFSNVFPRADYQAKTVQDFLDKADLPFPPSYPNSASSDGGVFNASGRAYPDVSAIGARYLPRICWRLGIHWWHIAFRPDLGIHHHPYQRGAPCGKQDRCWIRQSRPGKEIIINPFSTVDPSRLVLTTCSCSQYANPHVLNDVTEGSNPGCGTPGFSAGTGWDPVSGLG